MFDREQVMITNPSQAIDSSYDPWDDPPSMFSFIGTSDPSAGYPPLVKSGNRNSSKPPSQVNFSQMSHVLNVLHPGTK